MYKADKEQIAQWKSKHQKVYHLVAKGKSAYIREPDFNDIDYATSISVNSPLSFPKEIINQCWLDGDKELKEDVKYIMGVSAQIDQIVKVVEVEVKEV